MKLVFIAAGLYILAAAGARRTVFTYGVALLGSIAALAAGIRGLTVDAETVSIPFLQHASLTFSIDQTSATFLVISSISAVLLSLFATGYGKFYGSRTAASFSLGLAATLLVLIAADALTFLAGWELVTIFAYLMLTDEVRYDASGKAHYRRPLTSAAYRFLIFGEISSMLLMIGFGVLYAQSHSLSFAAVRSAGPAFLVLATLGAAVKMDVIPFHIWMPDVYEHTADHTAAFLSVPLTLMGVYGLERFISMGSPAPVWFILLVVFGAATAFWGSLQAAAARKLKSLPAYSTVENNGMLVAVIAAAALAGSAGTPSLTYLAGFVSGAAVVLALGHAVAKSLLFMSIGHARESLGVDTIDEMRGVWRSVGAVPGIGILMAGLSLGAFPPLVGYTGEWMVLETVFQASRFQTTRVQFFLVLAGVLIALAIGLAVFAMVKLIGYTALGSPSEDTAVHVPGCSMKAAQVIAAALLPLLGLCMPVVLAAFGYGNLFGGLLGVPAPLLLQSGEPLFGVISPTMFGGVVVALSVIPLLVWRTRFRRVRTVEPWYGGVPLEERECFREPAFSQILLHMLRRIYGTEESAGQGTRQLRFQDRLSTSLNAGAKVVMQIGGFLSRRFMNGHVYYYVLYIMVVFVVVLLIKW